MWRVFTQVHIYESIHATCKSTQRFWLLVVNQQLTDARGRPSSGNGGRRKKQRAQRYLKKRIQLDAAVHSAAGAFNQQLTPLAQASKAIHKSAAISTIS